MEADVSDIHEHLAFQFNIVSSECGGIFYVEVKDGYNLKAPLYKRVVKLKIRETEFERNTTKKIKRF